jgi:octaprenyl-diphosphate synthase
MDGRLKEYLAPISGPMIEFEDEFRRSIGGNSGLPADIGDYLVLARGKRMRPALVLLSQRSQAPDGEIGLEAAVAIELIHTATLLHDDVVDVSDRRRGRVTVNARWNNMAAVLMGDHLLARAFEILVHLRNHRVLDAVSMATRRVAIGELRQLQQNGNVNIEEGEYARIIADKTASLFGAACQAGLLMAKPDSWDAEKYQDFGETLGMSFQIVDDLLDYVGDTAKTGKTRGNDIKEGKITLPLIYALQVASAKARNEMTAIAGNYQPDEFDRVYTFIADHGGFDYARKRANQFTDRALTYLADVPESPYRRSLEMIVGYSVSRCA